MIVNSTLNNYWLTSVHQASIDAEGMYLPVSKETLVSDELGSYLLTLDGVVEVKELEVEVKPSKENKKP